MKTLLNTLTDEKNEFIFKGDNDEIVMWVMSNLKKFNLNEEHSCEVSIDSENIILIRGDEDRVEFKVVDVDVIDLKKVLYSTFNCGCDFPMVRGIIGSEYCANCGKELEE